MLNNLLFLAIAISPYSFSLYLISFFSQCVHLYYHSFWHVLNEEKIVLSTFIISSYFLFEFLIYKNFINLFLSSFYFICNSKCLLFFPPMGYKIINIISHIFFILRTCVSQWEELHTKHILYNYSSIGMLLIKLFPYFKLFVSCILYWGQGLLQISIPFLIN